MSDLTYPLFPIFAFLGFFLVLIPLPWHFQAWNSGTCLYMLWTAVSCLNQFVNSIVWHNNAFNPAPVWCDISSRIIIGSSVAIPAASLCINRRLYKIATIQTVNVSKSMKKRAIFEDLFIGLGIPLIDIALEYVVQGHRFNIFEDIGCYPAVVNVWLAYVLVSSWPIVIGLISAVYCILTLRAFLKRQAQVNKILASSSIDVNRYFRLMALASCELICTTPLAVYGLYLNLTAEAPVPYKGWSDLHFDFSRVDQFPALIWQSNHLLVISLQLSRWSLVACAFVFFGFFGFASEARKNYRAAFIYIAKLLHIKLAKPVEAPISLYQYPKPVKVTADGVLPVFVSSPNDQVKSAPLDSSSRLSFLSFLQSSPTEESYGHAV